MSDKPNRARLPAQAGVVIEGDGGRVTVLGDSDSWRDAPESTGIAGVVESSPPARPQPSRPPADDDYMLVSSSTALDLSLAYAQGCQSVTLFPMIEAGVRKPVERGLRGHEALRR